MKKQVVLSCRCNEVESELHFTLDMLTYEKYIDEMQPNKKVGPAKNYLLRQIDEADRETLKTILQEPGAAIFLAGELIEAYSPDLDVTVKK